MAQNSRYSQIPALAFKVVSGLCQQSLEHSELKGRIRLSCNGCADGLGYVDCVLQPPACAPPQS